MVFPDRFGQSELLVGPLTLFSPCRGGAGDCCVNWLLYVSKAELVQRSRKKKSERIS